MRTPDGTVLYSRYTHDCVNHLDANGEVYMLDGGLEYLRTSVNKEKAEFFVLYDVDPHEEIREHFVWGSRGVNGDEPLHFILIKDLQDAHIEALFDYTVAPHILKILKDEQEWRANAILDS